MSRLFAVTKSLEVIVAHFAVDMAPALEVPSETVEGTPGLIVLEKDGLGLLKSIPWGSHDRPVTCDGRASPRAE